MKPFVYNALPSRILFGATVTEILPAEIERLSCRCALLLSTQAQAEMVSAIARAIGAAAGGLFSEAAMHTPVDVTEKAMRALQQAGADCIVAIGGGSTIGLGKALALRTDLPQIAVPTTYAGSEVTPILGQTETRRKTTLRTPKVLPEVVIYDTGLTLGMPARLTVTSGMNAIAHAVEALWAQDSNPVIELLAERGIAALAGSLPVLVQDGGNWEARSDAQFGAWACGTCLGAVGMSLHHKLCHVLGGSFDLPHSETHTIILPHVVAALLPKLPQVHETLARILDTGAPAGRLYDIPAEFGAHMALRDLGMPKQGIAKAVREVFESGYFMPASVTEEELSVLLDHAWHGSRPEDVEKNAGF